MVKVPPFPVGVKGTQKTFKKAFLPLDTRPTASVNYPPMGQQLRIRAKRQRRLRRQRRIKDNAKAKRA